MKKFEDMPEYEAFTNAMIDAARNGMFCALVVVKPDGTGMHAVALGTPCPEDMTKEEYRGCLRETLQYGLRALDRGENVAVGVAPVSGTVH